MQIHKVELQCWDVNVYLINENTPKVQSPISDAENICIASINIHSYPASSEYLSVNFLQKHFYEPTISLIFKFTIISLGTT